VARSGTALDLLAADEDRALVAEGLRSRAEKSEQRSHPSSNSTDWATLFGYNTTASKITVTAETALRASAVYACVSVIAGTIGTLPAHVYRRLPGGGKEKAPDHPLYPILHDSPNDLLTSCEFREMMQAHLCLRGNAYARVLRDGGGRVVGLDPVHPDRVAIYVNGMSAVYVVTSATGATERLGPDQLLHLRGMGPDGVVGYSPITLARESIGLSLAAEKFGAKFFGNSARPSGHLEVPAQISPDDVKRTKENWQAAQGGDNQSSTAVLFGGIKWSNVSMTNDDAQFLETRKFQIPEIARIFRVPLHKIQDMSGATFSNIEHQSIEFVTDCVRPWAVRWEQRLNQVLLTPTERRSFFIELNLEGLLRGDMASRFTAYKVGREAGFLSVNDIRDTENMNRVDGGDSYMQPLNMGPLGSFPATGDAKRIPIDAN